MGVVGQNAALGRGYTSQLQKVNQKRAESEWFHDKRVSAGKVEFVILSRIVLPKQGIERPTDQQKSRSLMLVTAMVGTSLFDFSHAF